MIIPQYLKKGDTIGLICPAGYMPLEKTSQCVKTLNAWGFEVTIGKTVGNQFNYFSGTDAERLADLQMMLDDKNIKAIMCARGGYGLSRIIHKIDWRQFKKKPKWIIGFSDITILHSYLNNKLKIASLHAPMAGAFNEAGANNEYIQSIKKILTGKKIKYAPAAHSFNRQGLATGELIGGNLALLAHTIGSACEPETKNKILFIEDVGEYLYNADRMLLQLKHAGKLDNLAALLVGKFTEMKDTTTPFGQSIYEIIQDKIKEHNYPVCFDFPVGHVKENYALKCGIIHSLSVKKDKVVLEEMR